MSAHIWLVTDDTAWFHVVKITGLILTSDAFRLQHVSYIFWSDGDCGGKDGALPKTSSGYIQIFTPNFMEI